METVIFSVDSKLIADKNSSAEFNFKIPLKITNAVAITLSSIELPNSLYIFNDAKKNNGFKFIINDNEFIFSLENGNYDLKDIFDKIEFFFKNIEEQLDNVQINLIFDVDSIKFKISCNVLFSIYFKNESNYKSFGNLLGFSKLNYINKFNIVSEYIPDIVGNKYIFMKLNDFGNIFNNNKRYFSKIIINKESYEMIYGSQHKFVSKTFKFNQPIDIYNLNCMFEDNYGNLINFNGLDVSYTVEIKYIKNIGLKQFYEKFNYDEELMRMILMDSMLKYYLPDNNILPSEDNINKILEMSKEN